MLRRVRASELSACRSWPAVRSSWSCGALLTIENGSGKTTLLEAIAARGAIRPGGGRSYAETDDEREPTAISAAVDVTFVGKLAERPVPAGRSFCRDDGAGRAAAHANYRGVAAGRRAELR